MATDDQQTISQELPKKYPSSVDVAKLAGVSQSAVSRTFTEGASVSAKTRKKVMEAADALGYQPSMIPKILLTQRSCLIAVVIGGMYNPFYAGVLELLTRGIQKRGNNVLLFSVDHGEYIDEVIPTVLGYRVDGVISALSIVSQEAAESCAKMNIPVVLFNGKIRNEWVGSVCCDNLSGGRDVADLFLAQGARRFAYIGGKRGNLASEDRFAGYLSRLAESGIADVKILYGEFRYEGGYKAALELTSNPRERPEAVFCANDLMAIGALEAIRREREIDVPRDMMIAGWDDIPAAAWPSYQLTTVRQDAQRMVEESLLTLDAMIATRKGASGLLRTVRAPLVRRATTRDTSIVEQSTVKRRKERS